LLALILLIGSLIIQWTNRRRSHGSSRKVVNKLLEELRKESLRHIPQISIERGARLSKRIISAYSSSETTGLSSEELRNLAAQLERSEKEQERSLAATIRKLAILEDLSYAPSQSSNDTQDTRRLLAEICSELKNYTRRFQPR
jgi:glutamyl/glutaminyl-tRNA synthetase